MRRKKGDWGHKHKGWTDNGCFGMCVYLSEERGSGGREREKYDRPLARINQASEEALGKRGASSSEVRENDGDEWNLKQGALKRGRG